MTRPAWERLPPRSVRLAAIAAAESDVALRAALTINGEYISQDTRLVRLDAERIAAVWTEQRCAKCGRWLSSEPCLLHGTPGDEKFCGEQGRKGPRLTRVSVRLGDGLGTVYLRADPATRRLALARLKAVL